MSKRMIALSALLCFGLSGCKEETKGIAVLGVDQDGNEIHQFVPKKMYTENLSELVTSIQDSTIPVLNESDMKLAENSVMADQPANGQPVMAWGLRTVVVGVGLKFSFGVGPIIKMTVAPKTRVAFSNSKKPMVP